MATQEKTVNSLLETQTPKAENAAVTWANGATEHFEELDRELHDGFLLQSEIPNESDYRVNALLTATINYNKSVSRAQVASYDRAVDQMAKLACYKRTHTRDSVEEIFLQTRDGKIMAEQAKLGREYLEVHK